VLVISPGDGLEISGQPFSTFDCAGIFVAVPLSLPAVYLSCFEWVSVSQSASLDIFSLNSCSICSLFFQFENLPLLVSDKLCE